VTPTTAPETFAPRGRSAATLLFQPRPTGNARYSVYACAGQTPSVFVHERVLGQLAEAALDAFPNETIGVLLGRPCRDEQGTYAMVEAGLTAGSQEHEGTGGMVRISAGGRSLLHRRAALLYPVLEPVGWWHSHPHGPPWYSSVDLDEQATYPKPYHVGIVVAVRGYDAGGGTRRDEDAFGVYVGPEGVRLHPREKESAPPLQPSRTTLPPAVRPSLPHEQAAAGPLEARPPERRESLLAALFAGALALAIGVALWFGLVTGGGDGPAPVRQDRLDRGGGVDRSFELSPWLKGAERR
jgi:proteasome lid subunit RPN8/RPN11